MDLWPAEGSPQSPQQALLTSLLQILKPFLEESKYRNLLPLFVGHNLLLVSEEPRAKEMVRVLKGVPFLPLLGKQPPGALSQSHAGLSLQCREASEDWDVQTPHV